MAFAYVERLLDHPERVGQSLDTLEALLREIVSNNLYPDAREYYEPLQSLIESIEPYPTGKQLTPELLLRKFQSEGNVVDSSC
jgi:ubiquitin thioesterase protein OTUB1